MVRNFDLPNFGRSKLYHNANISILISTSRSFLYICYARPLTFRFLSSHNLNRLKSYNCVGSVEHFYLVLVSVSPYVLMHISIARTEIADFLNNFEC